MFRIDLNTGETLTLSGKKSTRKIHFIEAQQQTFDLTFVRGDEQYIIPANAALTMAADIAGHRNNPIFLAEGTVSADGKSVRFVVDTRTEEYSQRIHNINTDCMVDIYIKLPGEDHDRRLVRLTAMADPRIYADGVPPMPLNNYYTKVQIDRLLNNPFENFTFATPEATIRALPAGSTPEVSAGLKNNSDALTFNFDFAIPAGDKGDDGFSYTPLEQIFYHSVYGTVCHLDSTYNLTTLGFICEPWHTIKLWLCSADAQTSGNIVLTCGNNRFTASVTGTPQMFEWHLSEAVSGKITIQRAVDDPADTLKDASGNPLTLLAVDWRAR